MDKPIILPCGCNTFQGDICKECQTPPVSKRITKLLILLGIVFDIVIITILIKRY